MTAEEWILFISFNVVINVVLQVTAWKLGYRLATGKKSQRREENKLTEVPK